MRTPLRYRFLPGEIVWKMRIGSQLNGKPGKSLAILLILAGTGIFVLDPGGQNSSSLQLTLRARQDSEASLYFLRDDRFIEAESLINHIAAGEMSRLVFPLPGTSAHPLRFDPLLETGADPFTFEIHAVHYRDSPFGPWIPVELRPRQPGKGVSVKVFEDEPRVRIAENQPDPQIHFHAIRIPSETLQNAQFGATITRLVIAVFSTALGFAGYAVLRRIR